MNDLAESFRALAALPGRRVVVETDTHTYNRAVAKYVTWSYINIEAEDGTTVTIPLDRLKSLNAVDSG